MAKEIMMAATDDRATQWRPHLEALENSGQSQADYCREHDLVKSCFTYWKLRLRPAADDGPDKSETNFVPVHVPDVQAPGLTLHKPNGVALEGICGDNFELAQQLASSWL